MPVLKFKFCGHENLINPQLGQPASMRLGPKVFEDVLRAILDLTRELAQSTIRDYCRIHIGVSFDVCADVWNKIAENGTMPSQAKPKHLLWALMKLNLYDTDKRQAVQLKVDTKTARKWIWLMLNAIFIIKSLVVSCERPVIDL